MKYKAITNGFIAACSWMHHEAQLPVLTIKRMIGMPINKALLTPQPCEMFKNLDIIRQIGIYDEWSMLQTNMKLITPYLRNIYLELDAKPIDHGISLHFLNKDIQNIIAQMAIFSPYSIRTVSKFAMLPKTKFVEQILYNHKNELYPEPMMFRELNYSMIVSLFAPYVDDHFSYRYKSMKGLAQDEKTRERRRKQKQKQKEKEKKIKPLPKHFRNTD